MQNTVYECKQNGEDFFLSLSVTCSRFGNCPAHGLVTEQPQYSVVVCFPLPVPVSVTARLTVW